MAGAITEHTRKRLWTRARGLCAFPGCAQELLQPTQDQAEETVVGIECHIIAQKDHRSVARSVSSLTDEERQRWAALNERRHSYENLVVMCAAHSAVIDDPAQRYTVEQVLEIKRAHEDATDRLRREELGERHAIAASSARGTSASAGPAVAIRWALADTTPSWARHTLTELAGKNSAELGWLVGQVGDPPDVAAAAALLRQWPAELERGSKELVNAVIRLTESGGDWSSASRGWQQYAHRYDGAERADVLVRAAINAGVAGDADIHDQLLSEAERLDPDSPRLRLERMDESAPVLDRLTLLDELHSDNLPLAALIEASKALALMQVPDLDAAARHVSRARELDPESIAARAMDINLRVQRARLALHSDHAFNLVEAQQAQDDALALRDELIAMGRWEESARLLMLAADVAAVQRDPEAAARLLQRARPQEVASADGGVVLGEAALRAAAPELALQFVGDTAGDNSRRLRAAAALDLGGAGRNNALAELDALASGAGPEAEMAAFDRLTACLPPVRAPWSPDAAAVLAADGHERFVSSLHVMATAAAGDVLGAEAMAHALPAEPWAAKVRLRIAHHRGEHTLLKQAAQEVLGFGPDADARVLAAQGLLRAGDATGETILIGVAYDPNAPLRDRSAAFDGLLKALAGRDDWTGADRHWRAWRDVITAAGRADDRLSAWQVRVLHHRGREQ